MKKATHQQTKEHNRHLVLKNIFDHDVISRAEISRLTGLTRTTVSEIVAELLEEGLVNEIGIGESMGGKSPILLSIVKDSRCLIGLDIAQNQFRGAVVNLRGEIKNMITAPVIERFGNEPIQQIFKILDHLITIPCHPVVGIGVGTPGLVNTHEGTVINAVNFDWKDFPLAKILADRYHIPVFIYNDSQAAAMGEFLYGRYHQKGDNLIVINVGYGIGSGIIIDGRLFQGDGGGAGEIGHVVVQQGGHLCRCGHYGCLETVASVQALIRDAKDFIDLRDEHLPPDKSTAYYLEKIESAYQAGEPAIRKIVLEGAYYLGNAIANLVGTLNINHIVLVGEMTRFGNLWLEKIRQTMKENSLSGLAEKVQIEIGKLESNATLLGATALLVSNYSLLFLNRNRTPSDAFLSAR
ncbi:MAG: putative ROK-family transcriptional regulator [Anaerolineae bacterium]|jgi:predicted NBD/HSP70 family sugar kinase|nr:MAG: putative ROK-family transcriptional regulator [Anaerolineae bacterium]